MKVALRKVRLNNGGYDGSGQYWGVGQPLYYYESEDGEQYGYFRAVSRGIAKNTAKNILRFWYDSVSFYR